MALNPCEPTLAGIQVKTVVVPFFLLCEETSSALAPAVPAATRAEPSWALPVPAQPPVCSVYLQREEKEEEVC